MRPLITRFGAVGYVTKDPLCDSGDPHQLKSIIDGLFYVSKKERVQYLVIQPPNNGEAIAAHLHDYGFQQGSIRVTPAYKRFSQLYK